MSRSAIATDSSGPTSRGSLVDLAHDELMRLIADRELAEGERIVIDQFARSRGISLIPVREALARLHAEGLVTFERNKGYRVAPRPTLTELERLFEARWVIELGAADLAIERSTPEALDEMRAINQRIHQGSYGTTFEGFREFITLNERFHVRLVALADNPALAEAYRRLGYHQKITRPTSGRGPGDVKRLAREHDAILRAIEAKDRKALRKAITAHIASGLRTFEGYTSGAEGEDAASQSFSRGHASRRPPDLSVAIRGRRKAP